MADKKAVQAGKKMKDFILKDQNGQDFRLSEYKREKGASVLSSLSLDIDLCQADAGTRKE